MTTHNMLQVDVNAVEYGSPSHIIEAARNTMGSIDLDPASSAIWNQNVKAKTYFTSIGLQVMWFGNVWLNHPFGDRESACKSPCKKKRCNKRGYCIAENRPGNIDWIDKLVSEYNKRNINQACCICYSSMSEKWIQPLLKFPMCLPFARVNYLDENLQVKKGVQKGSVIFYLGGFTSRFITNFETIGNIYFPSRWIKGWNNE